jgi:hypothetical protein
MMKKETSMEKLSFEEWFDKELSKGEFHTHEMTYEDLKASLNKAWEASRANLTWMDL